MEWYKQKYVQRRDWIIEYAELLNLTAEEFQMVMLIDYYNAHNEVINQEMLCMKMKINQARLDTLLSVLMAKNYLKISRGSKGIEFSLEGLFKTNVARVEQVVNQNIHDVFESEFKRPLTQQEMEQLNKWVKAEDSKLIIYALKEASIYQKLSFNYIAKILMSWKEKGITVEKIENGGERVDS